MAALECDQIGILSLEQRPKIGVVGQMAEKVWTEVNKNSIGADWTNPKTPQSTKNHAIDRLEGDSQNKLLWNRLNGG